MTIHTPIDDGQITQHAPVPRDPEGNNSCVAYATAYAVADVTNGRVHPTGEQVRDWTGDHSGGLELAQVDRAVTVHTDLNMLVDVYTDREFFGHLDSGGYDAVLLGGYAPIAASKFDAFRSGFFGNHGIMVPPGIGAMDPGADGRPGAYRYHGEAYPRSLIRAFAAALMVTRPSRTNPKGRLAGPDHFEAGLLRIESAPEPAKPWELVMTSGNLWVYAANATHRTIAGRARHHSGGFSGACTPPARFTWPGVGSYTLVRMLEGSHKGWWIAKGASHVTIREV